MNTFSDNTLLETILLSLFTFRVQRLKGRVEMGNSRHVGEITAYSWCQGVEGAPYLAPVPSWVIQIP